jgi:hypothetical protein
MNSITISALVHSMWQRGHYMLQQVFRDNFNALLNLLVYVREAGRVCLMLWPSGNLTAKNSAAEKLGLVNWSPCSPHLLAADI